MSDNELDRLHFRLAGVIHKLRERFPFPKTGERQLKIVGAFVDRIGAELQDIDNTLYRLAQDRGETAQSATKIDAAFVDRVEDRVGMGHAAWDTISAIEICEAVRDELQGKPDNPKYLPIEPERCSRCGEPLNNISPGFGIVDAKLVCMPCLQASGEKPQLTARSL